VIEGVKAGETVVVSGQLALAPGAKVAPQPYVPRNSAKGQESPSSDSAL
jgi:enamine deaminase RidA (YjgF/YER057c/UK114 family)